MVKLFHTVVTTKRHREHGYCEDSDFGKIELIELSPTEKNLIVSFQDYKHKKEFIEYEGCAYLKVGECSNFGGMSRDKEAIWIAKQGKFTRNSAITLMLELRQRFESSFSYVSSAKYILIGKTLYARYSKIEDLTITVCGNMLFAHWISIDIEAHGNKRTIKLSKENFNKTVKEEYKRWVEGDPKTKNINGEIHSCFTKPTNLKWGENYL